MIVSFHPCFKGDINITCAGRDPNADDLNAIRLADVVVLNQGCRKSLYEMARSNCRYVFPNYDARFNYPGKIGQARLFKEISVPHPRTEIFLSVDDFFKSIGLDFKNLPFTFPMVFKFDWGGEGEMVHLLSSENDLSHMLEHAQTYEKTGQKGFVLQEYIDHHNRSLRTVVIGKTMLSYWRVSPEGFYTNLSRGAYVDTQIDPDIQKIVSKYVSKVCAITGINLAGFDLLFRKNDATPQFIEINYFFGRTGLGGSQKYYRLLKREITRWIRGLETHRAPTLCGRLSDGHSASNLATH